MKAMILAAGRGERMRPLTDQTPKPLLIAAGKPIIEYTILQLVAAGFTDIVINTAHLGGQLPTVLGNGARWGANINYSHEGEQALETAGGIINALPLLGEEPFLVVNGDIATDFNFAKLHQQPIALAYLVLISNPSHHEQGDFYLAANGQLSSIETPKLTFSGIGVYHPDLFRHQPAGIRKLAPILRAAMLEHKVSGEHFEGFWMDIGTPERLQALHAHYSTP
ncbi:MAG: nucleotidyltransferase family protein [Methylococcaceae bacterium]|nr:nucleotidyltransferase family protein [Methylococcaceae bacterium]